MGLMSTLHGTFAGALSDLWREFFYCDALDEDTLVAKGVKKKDKRSNNKGDDNIISNGSVVSVANGQCAIIVDNGLISDVCTEPGEYIYSKSSEPSLICGDVIRSTIRAVNERFAFAGQAPKDQRVYYVNLLEIVGMHFGTVNPIMFRVVDQRAGVDIDIRLKVCGKYSFRITNPVMFYSNVAGNVGEQYDLDRIQGQLKSEFLAALNPAFAAVSAKGIKYSELMLYSDEVAEACKEVLTKRWGECRGIEVVSIGLESVSPFEEDIEMVQELQKNATFTDARLREAGMASAQMDAMRSAAKNSAGAMTGFIGAGMAMGVPMGMGMGSPYMQGMPYGYQQQNYYQQPMQQRPTVDVGAATRQMSDVSTWECSCGQRVSLDFGFCPKCGNKRI